MTQIALSGMPKTNAEKELTAFFHLIQGKKGGTKVYLNKNP